MSERRQLALLLAGLVALMAVGIAGAALFPERCSGLDRLGELSLVFTDAGDALPVDADVEASLQTLGDGLGGRPWRGAVALPADTTLVASRFGFFAVTASDFTVLRPSIGIASASRGRDGLDVFAAGTDLGLRAADGETAILDSEYELARCGTLPPDVEVLDVDRGFAAVRGADGAVEVVTLSGDAVWAAPSGTTQLDLLGDVAVATTPTAVTLLATRTGEELDRVQDGPARVLGADDEGVLLLAEDGAVVDVPVAVEGAGTARELLPGSGAAVVAAARDGDGLLALVEDGAGGTALVRATGGAVTPVPVPVPPTALLRSEDGHLGLLVEVDGQPALLVYGPPGA